jgi:hypothetical protein
MHFFENCLPTFLLMNGRQRFPESLDERHDRLAQRLRDPGVEEAIRRAREDQRLEETLGAVAEQATKGLERAPGPPREAVLELVRSATRQGLETASLIAANALRPEDMSLSAFATTEAVIDAVSRPSWYVRDNAPEATLRDGPSRTADEFWKGLVSSVGLSVRRVAASTGAIFKDGGATPVGTAWVIGERLIATNAHVADALAVRKPGLPPNDPRDRWRMAAGAAIDFAFEHAVEGSFRVPIVDVLYVETSQTPDIAIFRLGDDPRAPPPLQMLLSNRADWRSVRIFAVGHPVADQQDDADTATVFGSLDATKRFSPGEIGFALAPDVIAHDCSTTNGSSGSPVVAFDSYDKTRDTLKVVGLHYFGRPKKRNEALLLPGLVDHPAVSAIVAGAWS